MQTLLISSSLLFLAFVSYRNYAHGLTLLTAILPTYIIRFTVAGIPTTFLESAIIIIAAVGCLQSTVRREWRNAWRTLPRQPLFYTLLFISACVIAVVVSDNTRGSLGILKGWVLSPLLLGWMVYGEARNQKSEARSMMTHALLLSGTVVALLGISQIGQLSRVRSIYDVPASLALYATPLIVIAVWKAYVADYQRKLYAICAAIMTVALIATQSLAALLAVTTALAIGIGLRRSPQYKMRIIASILMCCIIAALLFTASGRLSYVVDAVSHLDKTSSVSVRLQLWRISWQLIQESPLLGIGLGQFEPAYQQKLHEQFADSANRVIGSESTAPLPEFVFRDPHNWLLSFWLNTGIIGLASFIALHCWLVWSAIKKPRQITEIALALLSLLVYGLVDTIYWKNDLAALHWVLVGLLIATVSARRTAAEQKAAATERVKETED